MKRTDFVLVRGNEFSAPAQIYSPKMKLIAPGE
jgi:hypothetical protein